MNEEYIEELKALKNATALWNNPKAVEAIEAGIEALEEKDAEETSWISVSERLPEDLEPVNITWVNHEPEPYYHDIKDRNFVATGIYYRGQWYWYSTTCADYLGEYGSNEIDKVDDAVEIIAWMPLPQPYKSESKTKQGLEYADQDTLMSAT
jgi:hypothetical protein